MPHSGHFASGKAFLSYGKKTYGCFPGLALRTIPAKERKDVLLDAGMKAANILIKQAEMV